MKKILLCYLIGIGSLNASNIHLQCMTIYSIFSPLMNKNKNYEIADNMDAAAQQHMNVLKKSYSDEQLYELLMQENKKIFSLMKNTKSKVKFNKLAEECFSKDDIK